MQKLVQGVARPWAKGSAELDKVFLAEGADYKGERRGIVDAEPVAVVPKAKWREGGGDGTKGR